MQGREVTSKHLSRVQKIVNDRMELLEKDLKAEKVQKIEELQMQKETIPRRIGIGDGGHP